MNNFPDCPSCSVSVEYVSATEPWSDEHYQCPKCDGTYNIFQFCVFCKLHTHTRGHHIVPKSKGGKTTVATCETCESFIHKTWTHNELRDVYNNVETILANEKFQKFLKWRLKQPTETVFKSVPGKHRHKGKYT